MSADFSAIRPLQAPVIKDLPPYIDPDLPPYIVQTKRAPDRPQAYSLFLQHESDGFRES